MITVPVYEGAITYLRGRPLAYPWYSYLPVPARVLDFAGPYARLEPRGDEPRWTFELPEGWRLEPVAFDERRLVSPDGHPVAPRVLVARYAVLSRMTPWTLRELAEYAA